MIEKVLKAKSEAVSFEIRGKKFLTIKACVFEMEGRVEVWYLGKATFGVMMEREFKDVPISVISKRCDFKDMRCTEVAAGLDILKVKFER